MLTYRSRINFVLNYLEKNNNRISKVKMVDYLFDHLYGLRRLPLMNCEYTLIIRHITTSVLREYFDKRANEHNHKLSLDTKKVVKDIKLQLRLDDTFILNKTEQCYILDRYKFFNDEFDENGNYSRKQKKRLISINLRNNSPLKIMKRSEVTSAIKGLRGQRVSEEGICCICNQKFDSGWKYTTSQNLFFICCNCKGKMRGNQQCKIIYTPMG